MADSTSNLLKTPLFNLHLSLGAKMVEFAGYAMPIQYPMGIIKECQQTREKAGLFDVSHMGQLKLSGHHAAAELEKLVPIDIIDLPLMKQRYALFTNKKGGVLDDLMVTNAGDSLFLVVNAACKAQDIAHLKAHLSKECTLEILEDRALLALQGPKAATVMAKLAPKTAKMVFMEAANINLNGMDCFITRSGYTGEDGFEISVANAQAEQLANLLLADEDVKPIGLGARDSLRLEAGLCLYGHELNTETTPVESSLIWALSKTRRTEGVRPGNYLGAQIILQQLQNPAKVTKKRIALLPEGKIPARDGALIVNENDQEVGMITSGGFSPTLGYPIAMGFVQTSYAQGEQALFAVVRNKKIPLTRTSAPFVAQNYHRG